jgi:hypothetical protein
MRPPAICDSFRAMIGALTMRDRHTSRRRRLAPVAGGCPA